MKFLNAQGSKSAQVCVLLLTLMLNHLLVSGQSLTPAEGVTTFCPGEAVVYTINPSPLTNCSTYTWTVTKGSFNFGSSVTSTTTTGTSVTVYWNDVASTGTLTVTASCKNGSGSTVTLSESGDYAIRSLAGRAPENPRANVSLLYCSTNSVTLMVDVMFLQNTGGTTGIPQQRADGYEWTLPTGWSSSGSRGTVITSSEIINIFPDNGCVGGTVSVRAYKDCGSRKYSSSASISVNRVGVSPALPAPAGYQGPRCGNTTPVTFTAASLPCALNYRWTFPVGMTGPGGATGSYTTSTNTITLTPSGSASDQGTIAVDINLGCGTLTQTFNTPAYTDAPLSTPVFTSGSVAILCANGSGTVAINPVPGADSYTWYTTSTGTIYIDGSIRDSSNPLTTTANSITVSLPANGNGYKSKIFVVANRGNGCTGSSSGVWDVWAGTPKLPGALDRSLNPACVGEMKVAYFSYGPEGVESIEFIQASDAFWVDGGYSGLSVEPYYPATTYFTLRLTNTCGVAERRYNLHIRQCSGGDPSRVAQVFPNPASEEVTIGLSDAVEVKQNTSILIVNSQREKVMEIHGSNREHKVSVSGLPEGLYYIQIKGDSDEDSKRLVIKR
jgi:hypothetical protein